MRFELVEKKIGVTLRIHWRLPFGLKFVEKQINMGYWQYTPRIYWF